MEKLTIEKVKENGLLIFEVITGSKAYGLNTPASDTDIRGVFVLPENEFYSLEYTPQVSNETNDIVYYELKRFIELLSKNNPNILELLATPQDCVLFRHSIMDMVTSGMFLSKLCEKSFANYAYTQIKKAYGLEKKIVNPVEEERKSVLDFCFVYAGDKSIPLVQYLEMNNYLQENMGLTAVSHLKDCFNLYYSSGMNYSGIAKKQEANDVSLSSIPKGQQPVALLYFNRDGYSVYCKKYREYWDWVEKRNEDRYLTTMSHGKNYDSKNMMHVFRLLMMAEEIATEGSINVFRKDRNFLLDIKQGLYEYEDLVAKAEVIKNRLPDLYSKSNLPEEPDMDEVNKLLISMRKKLYGQ
ncbi:MAG: nucleotidyltransferase domain-containing protein [Chitinophagaceae bacterium]